MDASPNSLIDTVYKILSMADGRTRRQLFGLLLLMFCATGLEMAGLGLFLPLLQAVGNPDAMFRTPVVGDLFTKVSDGDLHGFLLSASVALFVFFGLKNLALAGILYIQNRFIYDRVAEFSRELLRAYLAKPLPFHLRSNSAELVRNVKLSVNRAFARGLLAILQFIMEAMIASGIIAVLLFAEPMTTLVVLAILGCTLAAYYLAIRRPLYRWGEAIQRLDGVSMVWLNQALNSVKETKLSGRGDFFVDAFAVPSLAKARYESLINVTPHLPRLLIETNTIGALLIVMIVFMLRDGSAREALPTLGLFAVAALRLMPSLSRLMAAVSLLKESTAAVEAIHNDFDATRSPPGEISATIPGQTAIEFRRHIDLEGVSYRYPSADRLALDSVDLRIARGQRIALVGRSGSGKTTLVDLILGLLVPDEGRILVDGRQIWENLPSWQRRIGYIPQTIYLIDDTLRRNIAFGYHDGDIDEDQLHEAVRLAHLREFVQYLPQGLDTIIGEGGARLSGGQRQRIGIARALYGNPEVLVMDEATAALDNETEREIVRAIDELAGDRTVLVIAHRLGTIRHCDRLFFMAEGKVAGAGTYQELLDSNPEFRRMVVADAARTS